ncbi:ARM repeat-containing protein [Calocera viscosa TUFC12733]|uniref:ARM repeat-containing protein n=1 Tax=Calocera viscosa (strain TUFC12733) TaxID=1330018 RepID=A0A167KF12_CALVF|nr:ARM repeat-containing protein [Calocera viscosa TUFC12733]
MAPKRAATTQGGPPTKKVAVAKGDKGSKPEAVPKSANGAEKKPKGKGKAANGKPNAEVEDGKGKPKGRKKTVTATDEETMEEESEKSVDELEVELAVDGEQMDETELSELRTISKQEKQARKEERKARKAAKPNADLTTNAKHHWSLARQIDISKEERTKHVKALMETIRGHVKEIVFKHDTSRIVQTLVKYGGSDERNEIAAELKGSYPELATSKYSKFLVTKLIRYCPSHRISILQEFQKDVIRLLLHREGSQVLADAYELYCNAAEKALLLRDFYGKEVALFDSEKLGNGGLKAVLEGATVERRRRVLSAVQENLMTIFNNPDKGAASFLIVHKATWEYLSELTQLPDEAEQDRLRRELFENCQELLAEFVHTRDGSRVVREFIARGSAKDRKVILKTLKPHIEKICKDEEAQLVLLTALDVIDDTKLLAKSVVSDITDLAPSLAFDKHKLGRRVVLYLLVPRSPRHFPPPTLALLSETDAMSAKTSKKDPNVRRDEIRKAGSADLITCVVNKGVEMMKDPGASLVVTEIMLYADGDKAAATETLLRPIREATENKDWEELTLLINHPHVSRLYKTLIQGGHYEKEMSGVVESPSWSGDDFASAFFDAAGGHQKGEALVEMASGAGAFLIAELASRLKETPAGKEMKSIFDVNVIQQIQQKDVRGSSVLAEKIYALN